MSRGAGLFYSRGFGAFGGGLSGHSLSFIFDLLSLSSANAFL
jgi:hypothetical protein